MSVNCVLYTREEWSVAREYVMRKPSVVWTTKICESGRSKTSVFGPYVFNDCCERRTEARMTLGLTLVSDAQMQKHSEATFVCQMVRVV